jgi:hypothetical protein
VADSSSARGPGWLAAFQAELGGVLRTPLSRETGQLRSSARGFSPAIEAEARARPNRSAREALAIYNRQYWFRLFGVMQGAFPLTTRGLGAWTFNFHAERFLLTHPPSSWDVDCVPQGFERFLTSALETAPEAAPRSTGQASSAAPEAPFAPQGPPPLAWPRAAILEAARIDAAVRQVLHAPPVSPFRPGPDDADRLERGRLRASEAAAWFAESWPLLEQRQALERAGWPETRPAPLPGRHPTPRFWVILRTSAGLVYLPLEAREAQLLTLLGQHAVGDALARLEAACPDDERPALPARTHAWLARSVELGVWSGLDSDCSECNGNGRP